MPINYSQKKVLIVDDFADFRRTVRGIVQQLGVLEIDQAGTAEEALKLCKEQHYDVILSDYNLGEGKDGQQFLEELKFVGRLRNQDVFLMITAENTSAMVMGALDYMPDGYLTKPFNKAMLQNRLDKIVEKKEALADIEQAMDKRQYERALDGCKTLIGANSPHALAALRLQAECLEKLNRLDEAADVYRNVLENRPLPWAMLGLGKLHFRKGEYEPAKALFEEITRVNPMFLNAFDWLAKTLAAQGEAKRAQQTLESAVKVSPKTILRQMNLGELARGNEDVDAAVRAYRSAIRLGKNSCYNTPDNYLHFSQSVRQKLARDGASQCKALIDDSQRALQEAAETYKERKDVAFRVELQRASLSQALGKEADANAALSKAEALYGAVEQQLSGEAMVEFAGVLKDAGQNERAQELLKAAASKFGDNESVMRAARALLDDQSAIQQGEEAQELNVQGVRLFEQGEPRKALACFLKARELNPDNVSINLNTAQAIVYLCNGGQGEPAMLKIGKRCLSQIGELPEDDKRHARFQELVRLINQMIGE